MGIYIRDQETHNLARQLARLKGVTLTEAVRIAVESALEKVSRKANAPGSAPDPAVSKASDAE